MDDQIRGVVGVDGIDGDAGAGAGQDRRALEADRLVYARHDALGDHVDVFGAAGALQDHDELVAAEPHAEIRRAAGIAHPLRGDHQHIVAGGMAERIVDLLEAVEVDLHHRHALVAPLRALDQRVEMVGEEGAVVQAGQPVMHGDEGHGIARIDQLMRLAQDDVGHRPEDEERYQDDDADGRVEQRAVQVERAGELGVGESVYALAERGETFKRCLGDGLVELRAFLARQIARRGTLQLQLGFKRGDEAPAIGGQSRGEEIEMIGLGEQHAFDGFRIEPGGRTRIRAGAFQKQVVVCLEFGIGLPERGDQRRLVLARRVIGGIGQEHYPLRQRFLRACERQQRLVALLRGHHLLQQHKGCRRHGGDDQQRDPVCALDEEDQFPGTGIDRRLLHVLRPSGECFFRSVTLGRKALTARLTGRCGGRALPQFGGNGYRAVLHSGGICAIGLAQPKSIPAAAIWV